MTKPKNNVNLSKSSKQIYLDYAAATPVDSLVQTAMQPYFNKQFYNPSALYLSAKSVRSDIVNARRNIAQIVGSQPNEIIFTAGGTESNNLAIHGLMQQFPSCKVLVSNIEHDSVLSPAQQYNHEQIIVKPDGIVDINNLKHKLTDDTILVSIMYANNELGTVQPIRDIAKIITKEKLKRLQTGNKLPLYFHSDASQASNYLDIHVSKLGIDLMSVNGGKIYGPKQTGFLYIKSGIKINPQILGGGQERGLRSGTENVGGIIGLSVALQTVASRRKIEVKRLYKLQQDFIKALRQAIPNVQINGSLKHRLPNNVHITIPGIDNERITMELDEQGIMCAIGSACSASSEEPSHVLRSIGLTDREAQSSLRFTMGIHTTAQDIKTTVSALSNIVTNYNL